MTENKTKPTPQSVNVFLTSVSEQRKAEAETLIGMMSDISGKEPVMWGPSIIGFGSVHYKYETGREGDMPHLSFSPRKASITIYFAEGFDRYAHELKELGSHRASKSCLYITKLSAINIAVLKVMLQQSYKVQDGSTLHKPTNVEEYIKQVPGAAREQFDILRQLAKNTLPNAQEVFSYGIIGYKIDDKRARVFVSGWKDHVAMYPIPKDQKLRELLKPYIKGKGTLWFALDKPLPKEIIVATIKSLAG